MQRQHFCTFGRIRQQNLPYRGLFDLWIPGAFRRLVGHLFDLHLWRGCCVGRVVLEVRVVRSCDGALQCRVGTLTGDGRHHDMHNTELQTRSAQRSGRIGTNRSAHTRVWWHCTVTVSACCGVAKDIKHVPTNLPVHERQQLSEITCECIESKP